MTDKLREAAQMAVAAWFMEGGINYYDLMPYMETLRAALAAPPEELDLPKVRLDEFLKLIEGKENFCGILLMRTEWPTRGKNND